MRTLRLKHSTRLLVLSVCHLLGVEPVVSTDGEEQAVRRSSSWPSASYGSGSF